MKPRLITYAIVVMLFALPGVTRAQVYVHEGSIGKRTAPDTVAARRDDAVPLDQWLGKRFVILPKPKDQQRYGYSTLRNAEEGFIVPTYDECAGQTVTVVDLYDDGRTDRKLTLQFDDGREYTSVSATAEFREIAPASDIDEARAKWEGKTIWLFSGPVFEYDARTGQMYSFEARNFEPVKVKEVVAGWDVNRPVRVIIETQDGLQGFLDVQWTSTNIDEAHQGHDRSGVYFLDHDPNLY